MRTLTASGSSRWCVPKVGFSLIDKRIVQIDEMDENDEDEHPEWILNFALYKIQSISSF